MQCFMSTAYQLPTYFRSAHAHGSDPDPDHLICHRPSHVTTSICQPSPHLRLVLCLPSPHPLDSRSCSSPQKTTARRRHPHRPNP
ncbi:hypothetical protein BC827DRAFT_1176137 [Russula dissimulans]|nr:hypothetical protein BC827DRAFT_1176137 [Russula dissimulans]